MINLLFTMINTNIKVIEKVLEIGGKRSSVPVHLQNYHMEIIKRNWEQNKSIYVTPKVDGVLTNFEYNGIKFECEKLHNNMFLIDIMNGIKYMSYNVRFKMLEKIFKRQILHNVIDDNDTTNVLSKLNDNFSPRDTSTIVIKPIFVINKTFSKNQNVIELVLKICSQNNLQYPTDGWIFYLDGEQPLKYKPYNHLTIDVEHNNGMFLSSDNFTISNVTFDEQCKNENGIYRCYYGQNKKWIAKEKREDKIRGNKLGTILTLEYQQIDFTFNPKIVISPYYSDVVSHNKNTESHNFRNVSIANVLKKIGSSVLDIGCGNGSLFYHGLKAGMTFHYTGIEYDPYILAKAPLGGFYLWQDMNNLNIDQLQLTIEHSIKYYDTVVFTHSLHFCDDIQKLFNDISSITKKIIIIGIFSDYYVNDFELNDVKVVKQENETYDFYYSWKDHKVNDKLLNLAMFNNLNSWEIEESIHYENNTNPFIHMHHMLVLKNKKNL